MRRFAPYLGIVIALLIGVLSVALSRSFNVTYVSPSGHTSTSTIATVPILAPSDTTSAKTELPATSTSSHTTSPTPVAPKKTVAIPVQTPPPQTPTQTPPPQNSDFTAATASIRAALVNIICLAPPGSNLHSISGSGIIISSNGYILTNAHVAQYFLLADRTVVCTIRTGSPATNSYTASLAFISPDWISSNASLITQSNPSGTGQYDLAILAITNSLTSTPLPAVFPYIPLAKNPPAKSTPVVIASYGAQFLDTTQIESSLFPTIVLGSVKDVFTFAVNTIDVIALGGSAAAQEGSSGGGVANANGELVGTVTTSTIDGATADRSLNAITASYVRGDYASETGSPLDVLLSESPSVAVSSFKAQASTLGAELSANISQ